MTAVSRGIGKSSPSSLSGDAAQFNPVYVGELARAAKILHGKQGELKVTISHNGDSAALVDLGHPDFIGVLMPLRGDAVPQCAPAWATQLPGQAAVVSEELQAVEVDTEELAQAA